ncbi:MAG: hypothetical protein ACRDIL_13855, partial [Candidatus Limnocylindrales bacterium]
GGAPDARAERPPDDLSAAPPAAPATPAKPQPADPGPVLASTSPAATAPAAETGAEPAPPATEPTPPVVDPPTDTPGGAGPIESASSGPEPAKPPRVVEPPATEPPPRDAPPDKGRRWSNTWVDADTCARHACPGRSQYHGGRNAGHRGSRAKAVVELAEHARPTHARRPS